MTLPTRRDCARRQRPRAGAWTRPCWPNCRLGWVTTAPRRDGLIEALHTINDRLRCLPTPHLAALAQWMKLSQAEVYEVASFYHHFDIVREEGADGRCAPARR
jgi:hypothetical protein